MNLIERKFSFIFTSLSAGLDAHLARLVPKIDKSASATNRRGREAGLIHKAADVTLIADHLLDLNKTNGFKRRYEM